MELLAILVITIIIAISFFFFLSSGDENKNNMDAGYKVLRYPRIPTANTIKNDIYRRV